MALVLGQTVAGTVACLFLTPLWAEVRRGFFKLAGVVLLVLAVATWGAVAAGLVEGNDVARRALWLSGAVAILTLVWVALLFFRLNTAARAVGFLSVAISLGMLLMMADAAAVTPFNLLAGAAFLGAVMVGLLLGHWYLTDRGLTRAPINRFTRLLIVAVMLEAAAVIAAGFQPSDPSPEINPLLTAAGLAPWIALGMVAVTALIAVMIRLTLKGTRASAVQAATGFFYLAVITALTAEFAAKVRFVN
jgi:hypothetical protein